MLTPTDKDNNEIPQSTNTIHPRQSVVINNKDKEIDMNGNIVPESKFMKKLRQMIKEEIENVFSVPPDKPPTDEEILINASVDDISVSAEEIARGLYNLPLFVDNKQLHIEGLLFEAEDKSRIEENSYQLHIVIPPHLRQKGIAKKLYSVFLKKCANIVSLYSNRVGTYAKEQNKSESYDGAIDKILVSVAQENNANIEKLYNDDKEIGIIVTL